MSEITHITVIIAILRLPLSDKAKFLLGLIHKFGSSGLIIGNAELGKVLCCSPDYIGKLLKEISRYITIQHPQSRYRKIFYSGGIDGVETELLSSTGRSEGDSTQAYRPATQAYRPATQAYRPATQAYRPATQHCRTATQAHSADRIKQKEGTKKNKTRPQQFSPDSVEIKLAQCLLDLILARKPDFRCPDIQTWAKQIDLMIRNDHRKPKRIEAVIKWCQADAGNGNGWAGWRDNILSTAKLREKFDKLELLLENSKNDRNTATRGRFQAAPDALAI